MKFYLFSLLVALHVPLSAYAQSRSSQEITRIAFGSCAKLNRPQTIWKAVNASQPDLWIWLGDNVYGDTTDMEKLAKKYAAQKSQPGYTLLRESSTVIGTWDDHDYGINNGGKEFSAKIGSQQALLDFLDEPAASPRRQQKGVYWSYTFGTSDRIVKIFLFDVRYHRDSPKSNNADILGEAQWSWLERELKESEATLTIIASGIQIIPEEHKYEKWTNFPAARNRLYATIRKAAASNVIFLSGDRHIAEISKELPEGFDKPLYEITSSSLTHSWTRFSGEANRHRVGRVFAQNNFGLLEIDWPNHRVLASIQDEDGIEQRNVSISF